MNWKKVDIKKHSIPLILGAIGILAIGTLYKSYKKVNNNKEVEKEKMD